MYLRPLGPGIRTPVLYLSRQYFSRLDTPRGQLRNQFAIRGQKIVITQLLGQNPRNLFKRLRNYLRRRNRCRVETNFQFLRRFRVLVAHAPQFCALHQLRSQFLAQLPRQRGLGFFAVLDLASGKLPFERGSVVPPPLTDQQPTIAPFNDRRHHHSHLSAPFCARSLLRADRKSTRLNSSHPSISYAVFCLKKKINNFNTIDKDKSAIPPTTTM